MKETEVLLTAFAEEWLDSLTPKELKDFEELLQCPDSDILNWLTKMLPVPEAYDTRVFQKLLMFRGV